MGYKLPFVSPNSKNFREDVKIESLKKYRDITIGKMDKIEQTFRNAEKVEKFVHEYYQKANQFGMIYSTNFSNLI